MKHDLIPERNEEIRTKFQQGKTIKGLAQKYQLRESYIQRLLSAACLSRAYLVRRKIEDLWNQGKNVSQILKETNTTRNTIYNTLEKRIANKKVAKEHIREVVKMCRKRKRQEIEQQAGPLLSQGLSCRQVEKILGLKERQVDKIRKQLNLPSPAQIKRQKLYQLFPFVKADLGILNVRQLGEKYGKDNLEGLQHLFGFNYQGTFTQHREKEIIRLFTEEKKTNKQIAKDLDTDHGTVSVVLAKHNLQRKRISPQEKEVRNRNLVQDYDNGMTIKELNQKYNLTNTGMTLWLLGVESRERMSDQEIQARNRRILNLYNQGKSNIEISKSLNIPKSTVSNVYQRFRNQKSQIRFIKSRQ